MWFEWTAEMQRTLTIVISDDVYRGLCERVGPGEISQFIEELVRPYAIDRAALEQEYREAALDEEAEREAREWLDAPIDAPIDDE
jgi:predicted CopG family antitoxin